MNLLIGILISILFFIILPIIYGQVWKDVIRDGGVIFTYISGFFTVLAIFELISPIMILLSVPTNTQMVVQSIVLLICACMVILFRWKDIVHDIKCEVRFGWIKDYLKYLSKLEKMYLVIFFTLFLAQVFFAAFYDIGGWRSDDYAYTVISSSAIYDNSYFATEFSTGAFYGGKMAKYMFCAIYSFYTYASMITGWNVSIIEHTVCVVLFLLIAYGVFYLLSKALFSYKDDREKKLLFLIFLALLFLFGLYSHYSITFRLFGVIWQGKAILAAVMIPFLIAIYPQLLDAPYKCKQILFCAMVSLATISLTMMGIIVIITILGILTLLHANRTRDMRCGIMLIATMAFPTIVTMAYLLYT